MKKIDSKHFIYAVTSKDIRSDLIDDGIKKGAETFLQKPIMPDAIRDMWPIFELRKVNQTNNTMIGSSLAKVPTDMGQSSRPRKSDDKVKSKKSITSNLCLLNIYNDNGNITNNELFILA